MKINITSTTTNYDVDNNIEKISVAFAGYDGLNSINANVEITTADLNEKENFDDLTNKMIFTKAKAKVVSWFK